MTTEIQPDHSPRESQEIVVTNAEVVSSAEVQLGNLDQGTKERKYMRFVLAALGSIPWVGGVLGAAAALNAENDQNKVNTLQRIWIQEHEEKIKEVGKVINDITTRFESCGGSINKRLESPEYLTLVRSAFRSWDQADTQEKRDMYKKLITNAGGLQLCQDDLIRLFINWIDIYHEAHFMVIREIYKKGEGITRGAIWDNIHSERPREDSAEADLFRYLIRELSTGGVIRQIRETTWSGEFIKKHPQKHHAGGQISRIMESAFEDTKPYELTELGKQFVHYVMDDLAPQLEQSH